jgi:hypothetical protein
MRNLRGTPKIFWLIWLLLLLAGFNLGLSTGDSDSAQAVAVIFVILPLVFGLGIIAVAIARWAVLERRTTWRFLTAVTVLAFVCSGLLYFVVWQNLHPRHIRYKFNYGSGASGTWHEVQFYSDYSAKEAKGPWVGGWPLKVSFPDLNKDGFQDIQVHHGNWDIVEFVYQPLVSEDKCWKLHRNEGPLMVHYPPSGIIYP